MIKLDREAWCAAVHGVTKSWIWLSDWADRLQLMIKFVILGIESYQFWLILIVVYVASQSRYINSSSITLAEKAMAPHSGTPAWKIPWTEEPGRLQSMGSLRVGHDWATSLSLFTFMHWRRKWQPTPVFLPGESQGGGAWWAAVYGVTESDTTEVT